MKKENIRELEDDLEEVIKTAGKNPILGEIDDLKRIIIDILYHPKLDRHVEEIKSKLEELESLIEESPLNQKLVSFRSKLDDLENGAKNVEPYDEDDLNDDQNDDRIKQKMEEAFQRVFQEYHQLRSQYHTRLGVIPTADLETMVLGLNNLLTRFRGMQDYFLQDDYKKYKDEIKERASSFIKKANHLIEEKNVDNDSNEVKEEQESNIEEQISKQRLEKAKEAIGIAESNVISIIKEATEQNKQMAEFIEQSMDSYVQDSKKQKMGIILDSLTNGENRGLTSIPSSQGNISGVVLKAPNDKEKGIIISTNALLSLFSKHFDNNLLSFDQEGNSYYINKSEIISLDKGLVKMGTKIAEFDKESQQELKSQKDNQINLDESI